MSKIFLPNFCATLFVVLFFVINAQAQSIMSNERFVQNALQDLQTAEATYFMLIGSPNYGNLQQLGANNLIDAQLATGQKYGYQFTATPVNSNQFTVSAVPLRYGKSGKRSFFINRDGEIHGADKGGTLASLKDPILTLCYGEASAISTMRRISSAESIYFTHTGTNLAYGTLSLLAQLAFISHGIVDDRENCEYLFEITTTVFVSNQQPAQFKVYARPTNYPVNVRSFYIDQTGVLRGADHAGGFPAVTDPPVPN